MLFPGEIQMIVIGIQDSFASFKVHLMIFVNGRGLQPSLAESSARLEKIKKIIFNICNISIKISDNKARQSQALPCFVVRHNIRYSRLMGILH